MTCEHKTPDRPRGQADILHFTVFCVLLCPFQHFRGLPGIQRKLAFQGVQRREFGFRPQKPYGRHPICAP